MKNIERTADMREAMVKVAIEDNLRQKQDLVNTRVTLIETINATKKELEQGLKDSLSRIEYNSSKIIDFEKDIKQNTIKIQDIRDSVKENTKLCVDMKEKKLDATLYKTELTQFRDQFTTVKFAVKDNFSQLLATDNYIEKYLPFKI
jgi:hypothetical protein